jgi:hypothetical protein
MPGLELPGKSGLGARYLERIAKRREDLSDLGDVASTESFPEGITLGSWSNLKMAAAWGWSASVLD